MFKNKTGKTTQTVKEILDTDNAFAFENMR